MNSTEENPKEIKKSFRRPLLIIAVILIILIAGLFLVVSLLPKAGKGIQKSAKTPVAKKINIPSQRVENKIIIPNPSVNMAENEKAGATPISQEKTGRIADMGSTGAIPAPVKTEDALSGTKEKEGETSELVSMPTLVEKSTPLPLPKKTENEEVNTQKKSDTSPMKKGSNKKTIRIETHVSQDSIAIEILTDGEIKDYTHFFLKSPPRLVIDLAGNWEKPDETGIAVESDLVKKIRIWPHPNKLRIVSDLKKTEFQTPVITPISYGLSVILKKK